MLTFGKIFRWFFRSVALIGVAFLMLSVLHVVATKRGHISWTPLMTIRRIEAEQQDKVYKAHHQWVDFEQISPEMVRAVMASEDNLFLKHKGFSKRGIRQAIGEYRETGHVRHGGSTISQQTAKNVFTTGRKNFFRKGMEVWYTFLIEHIWGKRRIMEVYLNVIEMGDGIYGVEAASQSYFHHSAARLNRKEAALIAVCLPNPRKMHVDRPSTYVRKRQQQIIVLMPKLGKIEI